MKNENAPAGTSAEKRLKGIPASPGIAAGRVSVIGIEKIPAAAAAVPVPPDQVPAEIERFRHALADTRAEISELRHRVQESLNAGDAGIFDAHLMIVDDKMLMNEVIAEIERSHLPADAVFSRTIQRYISAISAVEDEYLKERAADVADVAARILRHLRGIDQQPVPAAAGTKKESRIAAAHDLAPSDTAALDRNTVLGFATETGSRTCHSAILARSMKLPAVVGVQWLLSALSDDAEMIIDGFQGDVIVNPSPETLAAYAKKEAREVKLYSELLDEKGLCPETVDGRRVNLSANIDSLDAAEDVRIYGAGGVGLFRTEYLFMGGRIPTEEEQFAVYSELAKRVAPEPVVIRTLDLGGDKVSSLINFSHEPNPFLGLRSVRLCLAYPQLIIPQLRAILRAGVCGDVRMMFPMITCLDELERLLELVESARQSLKAEKIRFSASMKIGMMVETPAAAFDPEPFAEKCAFFSIGTNDLVQYVMAVDRGNERVAGLYRPLHPPVLRLIAGVVKAASARGIPVTVCGEMASDPNSIPILLGLGVQELSMAPVSLGLARRIVRRIRFTEAESLAAEALKKRSQTEVLKLSRSLLNRIVPDAVGSGPKK